MLCLGWETADKAFSSNVQLMILLLPVIRLKRSVGPIVILMDVFCSREILISRTLSDKIKAEIKRNICHIKYLCEQSCWSHILHLTIKHNIFTWQHWNCVSSLTDITVVVVTQEI